MNRFKTRRKAKAETPDPPKIPEDAELSTHSLNPLKKSKKKSPPAARPELDLSNVLPSNDTFRTSLIMPKLSARFSMLRDQDDPSSLLGKANDDSVLDVKRNSRLMDYGFLRRDLSIISEVTSSGSMKGPTGTGEPDFSISEESFATEDESRSQGSIINRSRPFESNNMFGGRQKVYKVLAPGSAEEKRIGHKQGRTRALYDADLTATNFHASRERSLAEGVSAQLLNRDEINGGDHREETSELSSAASNKRETSSSTNSVPSVTRTSTVASSVGSQIAAVDASAGASSAAKPSQEPAALTAQGIDRTPARPKRLYERGLDQHLHDQQSSAMNRLDTIHRLRSRPTPLDFKQPKPRSASNPPDAFHRPKHNASAPAKNEGSLPPSPAIGFEGFDFRFENLRSSQTSTDPTTAPLPASPTISHIEAPLQSPSIGSTASGFRRGSAATVSTNRASHSSRRPSDTNGARPKFSPRADSFQFAEQFARATMDAKSRNQSPAANSVNMQAYGVFHRAAEKIRSEASTPELHRDNHPGGTFFAAFSESESEFDNDWQTRGRSRRESEEDPRPAPLCPANAKLRRPSRETEVSKFPKLYTYPENDLPSGSPTFPDFITSQHDELSRTNLANHVNDDSPTLGPVSGLNGLIRKHLRVDSYQSSLNLAVGNSNLPADLDLFDPPVPNAVNGDWTLDYPSERPRSRSKGSQKAHHKAASSIASVSSNPAEDYRPNSRNGPRRFSPWEEESRGRHARGGSTETQVERAEFANELAQRRKMIEQNMRALAENESRSASRAESPNLDPIHKDSPMKSSNPFGILKSKSSKSSLTSKQDGPNKLSKVRPSNANGLNIRQSEEELRMQQEEQMLREIIRGPKIPGAQPKAWSFEQQANGRENDPAHHGLRHASDPERVPSRSHQRTESRDRSVSETSAGRARSRSRSRPREAPRHTVMDAFDSAFGELPTTFVRASPDMSGPVNSERSPIATPTRFRSNSNSPALPNYFERPPLRAPPSRPESPATGLSTHASPTMPNSGNSTPPFHEGSFMPQNSPPIGTAHPAEQVLTRTYRKKPIQKSDISEPTLISSTSTVTTIDLPQGPTIRSNNSNINNDRDVTSPPPVPPLNPRRKRGTATQSILGAFGGGRTESKYEAVPNPQPSPAVSNAASPLQPVEEQSSWSDDEDSPKRKPRHRLRKSISEGTSLRIRSKQSVVVSNTPPLPRSPIPPSTVEGQPI